MSGVELFTTRVLPPDRRQNFWRALIAETFPGMVADAPNDIQADLARWSVGRLGLVRATSNRSRVGRTHDGGSERALVFHLQRRGQMMMNQMGRMEYAGAGDILIAEEQAPYSIDISDANDCLIVHVPATMLGAAIAGREWCSRRLDGHDPHVRLLGRMLGNIWEERGWVDRLDDGMDEVLLGMTRIACLKGQGGEEPVSRGPIDFALLHLHDPDLGTASIAQATGLSPRAVQKAFARHMGCSPTGFITEQRLQRAGEALRKDRLHTVTQIAFDIGFSDAGFFARCFRRRYGVTPSQWREMV
jgi:AraC-like DNA-binding protein